jgi:GT2 family glycosyltransferase
MYNPKTMDFDVSVILTLYKRPEKLFEQLIAIENQTLKPKEILLFHDAADSPIEFEYSNERV